jgi:hypothetical protein
MLPFVMAGILDPNLAALIIFTSLVIFSLVVVYLATLEKEPRFIAAICNSIATVFKAMARLFNRLF